MLGQAAFGIAASVYRIKDDPAGAEASLAAWGM